MSDFWSWATDKAVAGTIKAVVKAVIMGGIAGGTLLLTQVAQRRGEVKIADDAGHTMQSPKMLVISVMCGALALAFLIWGFLDPESINEPGNATAWFCLVAGFTLGFLLLAMLSTHRWTWDGDRFEWQRAFSKRSLAWRDLVSAGPTWEGQFAAKDKAGRKIRWSTYTLEHEALTRIARAHLPRAEDKTSPPNA